MVERILGNEPDKYSYDENREYNCKAVVKVYELVTSDWFEIGGAYSLHLNNEDALEYEYDFYREYGGVEEVYVTQDTINKIEKARDKNVFRSWGH
tara:strand:- start:305 stop:589 length:285 start_codon:yes stop_codon:yes gene_type:complete